MTPYLFMRLIHVGVAVVGLGVVVAVGLLARDRAQVQLAALRPLLRVAAAALGLVFVSGIGLDLLADRAFDRSPWFRAAALSLVACGAAIGWARRVLARGLDGRLDPSRARVRIARAAWLACALVAWIVFLMEVRIGA